MGGGKKNDRQRASEKRVAEIISRKNLCTLESQSNLKDADPEGEEEEGGIFISIFFLLFPAIPQSNQLPRYPVLEPPLVEKEVVSLVKKLAKEKQQGR